MVVRTGITCEEAQFLRTCRRILRGRTYSSSAGNCQVEWAGVIIDRSDDGDRGPFKSDCEEIKGELFATVGV